MSSLGCESGGPYLGPRPRGSGGGGGGARAVRRGGGSLGEGPGQSLRKRRGAPREGPGEEVGVRRRGQAGCDGAPPRHGFPFPSARASTPPGRSGLAVRCGAVRGRGEKSRDGYGCGHAAGVPATEAHLSPLTVGPFASRLRPEGVAGRGPPRLVHRAHARGTQNPPSVPLAYPLLLLLFLCELGEAPPLEEKEMELVSSSRSSCNREASPPLPRRC